MNPVLSVDTLAKECFVRQGREEALRYILRRIRASCDLLPRPPSYLCAINDVTVLCEATLSRLERGEPMESTSVVMKLDCTTTVNES